MVSFFFFKELSSFKISKARTQTSFVSGISQTEFVVPKGTAGSVSGSQTCYVTVVSTSSHPCPSNMATADGPQGGVCPAKYGALHGWMPNTHQKDSWFIFNTRK